MGPGKAKHLRTFLFGTLIAAIAVTVVAASAAGASGAGKETLLQAIKKRGYIVVSLQAIYPPGAFLNKSGKIVGFEPTVAEAVARQLGVKVKFVQPSFEVVTAGHWFGRWDMSVQSVTITQQRTSVLLFTKPYNQTEDRIAVLKNSPIHNYSQLTGKKIGACTGCAQSEYLQHNLVIPGEPIKYLIKDPVVRTYEGLTEAYTDLKLGRIDAVIGSLDDLCSGEKTFPLRFVSGPPLFFETEAIAFDKNSSLSAVSLRNAVNGIIEKMKTDGELDRISQEWYHYNIINGTQKPPGCH